MIQKRKPAEENIGHFYDQTFGQAQNEFSRNVSALVEQHYYEQQLA